VSGGKFARSAAKRGEFQAWGAVPVGISAPGIFPDTAPGYMAGLGPPGHFESQSLNGVMKRNVVRADFGTPHEPIRITSRLDVRRQFSPIWAAVATALVLLLGLIAAVQDDRPGVAAKSAPITTGQGN
jgi:hypothetical protein